MKRRTILVIAALTALSACDREEPGNGEPTPGVETPPSREQSEAVELMNKSVKVLEVMKSDADLRDSLAQARGIFIVPDYGRAAAVVGASGGEGLLVVRRDAKWSDPIFYNVGSLSIGAQAGVKAGHIALLLMTDKAVDAFKNEDKFSLDADAGLTFIAWDAAAETTGKDVIFWSETEGLFVGAALSISDISWDGDENRGVYGDEVSMDDVISGKVKTPESGALQRELSNM